MPVIIRQSGFEVAIYTNDHRPPHVHVFKAGTEAIINLIPVSLAENYRMSKKNARKAVEIVEENEALLGDAWREIHGDE